MSAPAKAGGIVIILGAVAFLTWALVQLIQWTRANPVAAAMGLAGMAGAFVIAVALVVFGVWLIGLPSPLEAHLAQQHAWRQRR